MPDDAPGGREPAPDPDPLAEVRQFVAFTVDGRGYGIDIARVREIIRWTAPTPLPNQPEHARGVLNLRGAIVPVHDLRARLGGPPTEPTETHVIVVCRIGGRAIGILVDTVSDIVAVAPDAVRPPPPGRAGAEVQSVTGLVGGDDGSILAILEPAALFGPAGAAPA